MLTTLLILFALQSVRVGPKAPTGKCEVMAEGVKEHFADGITVLGKLIWPSELRPEILDVELEDEGGIVVASVKSEPNNQFRFNRVAIVNPEFCSFKTYSITINATRTLSPLRQRLSLTTANFSGAEISIQLLRLPGLVSRNTEAVISIDGLKPDPPKDALAAFDKAMEEARKGDLKKSTVNLTRAVKIAPDFYEANLELGLQYDQAGQHDEAERLLTHALMINPASMRARAALGKRAYEMGDFQKTADLLSQATLLGNTSGEIYFMLGEAYFKLGSLDQAEASLQRALVISPGLGSANFSLHNVYLKRQQLDKALVQLDTYLQKHPDAPDRERVQAAADKLRKAVRP